MTGLPDIATVNKSSTRDPFASKQHLLMNDLKEYNKHFFIGGSANWGDIGGFFRGNVEEIITPMLFLAPCLKLSRCQLSIFRYRKLDLLTRLLLAYGLKD